MSILRGMNVEASEVPMAQLLRFRVQHFLSGCSEISLGTQGSAPLSMNTDLCFHSLLLRFQPPTLRDSFVSLGKKAFLIP